MDLEMKKMDGSRLKLSDHGIIVQDVAVSSITTTPRSVTLTDRPGKIDYGAQYLDRTIRVPFHFFAITSKDFINMRNTIYKLLSNVEPFYIREIRSDGTSGTYPVPVHYKVRLQNTIEIEQINNVGLGEFVFTTVDLPFAESVYAYQVNNLYNTVNDGDVTIEPYYQELQFIIYNIKSGAKLINRTNGTYVNIPDVAIGKALKFDGVHVTAGGINVLDKTGANFITLEVGVNEIRFVEYVGTPPSASVLFRKYYL